jgi:hypothetical protein
LNKLRIAIRGRRAKPGNCSVIVIGNSTRAAAPASVTAAAKT